MKLYAYIKKSIEGTDQFDVKRVAEDQIEIWTTEGWIEATPAEYDMQILHAVEVLKIMKCQTCC